MQGAGLAQPVTNHGHWIDGRDQAASDGRTFPSYNPTTGDVWGRFALGDKSDVAGAVAAAKRAFAKWRAISPTRRGRLLMRWADLIHENAEKIGRIETSQNGKLLNEMVLQARIVPDWLYYYGGLADKIEGKVIPLDRTSVLNYTLREPLGVVGVIMPWNSPLFLATMAVAPALAAGNTVVIKPSEVTPASMVEAARLAEKVGIPPGVINVVTGDRAAGEALIDHPDVAKVAFTGGVEAGRAVGTRAAARFAHFTLELGGKSANIVFPDADLRQAEAGLLAGIFAAAGQTCVAGSRALVHRKLRDDLLEALSKRAAGIRIGDPLDAATQMGPVASRQQLEKDEGMVKRALADGAELVYGGGFPQRLLLLPDDPRERRTRQLHRPERGVRPGAVGDPLRGRGGGDRHRQRHALRPRRRRLDPRHPPRPPRRPSDPDRHRVDQHVPRHGLQLALRRLQVERHRPPERHRGDGPVSPDQERVVRTLRRGPGPVRHAVVTIAKDLLQDIDE